MRILIPVVAMLLASCAASRPPPQTSEELKVLGERIEKICSLPAAEREAEIAKLKKESGMVLYCGGK